MPLMTPEHDGRASIKPRSKRWRWIVLIAIVILAPIGLWRGAREISPAFPSILVGVDQTFTSPNGTNEVRVVITDGGATGYGGIGVYRYSPWTGYDELYFYDPAVARGGVLSVKWSAENEILLKFEDPNASFVEVRVTVAP